MLTRLLHAQKPLTRSISQNEATPPCSTLLGRVLAIACALAASPVVAQTTTTDISRLDPTIVVPGKPPGYSPYAGRNFHFQKEIVIVIKSGERATPARPE